MRSLPALLGVLLLTACVGGTTNAFAQAGSPPGGAPNAAIVPAATGKTLWVGTPSALYAYPTSANGTAPVLPRTITFGAGRTGSIAAIGSDGTVYAWVTGVGLVAYAPGAGSVGQPLSPLADGVLVGDVIERITASSSNGDPRNECDATTVSAYPLGSANPPVPVRTFTARFACQPVNAYGAYDRTLTASDGANVYLYHFHQIEVFRRDASGNDVPVRTVTAPPAVPANLAVDTAGDVYVVAGDRPGYESFAVHVWNAGNDGPAESRTIGPFSMRGAGGSPAWDVPRAIAADINGTVYVAAQPDDRASSAIYTFGPNANGAATPSAALLGAVPAGTAIDSLAIGP